MNRNRVQPLSNNYTYVSKEHVSKSASCQDIQSTDTPRILTKLNQLVNLARNIPQIGDKIHAQSEGAVEIILYFCIAELETINTQSGGFECGFFSSSFSATTFTRDGCDYIILLGELITIIGKLYPNKFQIEKSQDILSMVAKAKEDVKPSTPSNLDIDLQMFSSAVYCLNKIICSNLSPIKEISHLDYLWELVSGVDLYYKDIKPRLLAAILYETEAEIEIHYVEDFKHLIKSLMSNTVVAKIDTLDLLARATTFVETPNYQEFYQLAQSIQSICDKYPDKKRILLEKLKLPIPQSVIEYIDILNYISSSRKQNHIHIYTERTWIIQLQLPATYCLHEFRHLYFIITHLVSSLCDHDVKSQLKKKLFSQRVIPDVIYKLSEMIIDFFQLKGITFKLIMHIAIKIINSYDLKISIRSLLNILSICVVDIKVLFSENENPKTVLLDFINKICSQNAIVKPSTNIKHKLDIWLDWVYADCNDIDEYHWFDDNRMQRGNPYGLCHSLTMEHLLVKIIKRETSISDYNRSIIASFRNEKYRMSYLDVFSRDFKRFSIGPSNLLNRQESLLANFGYAYSDSITFIRDQFSGIVKHSIAEFMHGANSDLLITKLYISKSEYLTYHYTFFSICRKEVFGCEYYSMEYYDSEYNKTGTYGKGYTETCITQDTISNYKNYISYTQHLFIPAEILADTTIPCPFSSIYGDSFTMMFYKKL